MKRKNVNNKQVVFIGLGLALVLSIFIQTSNPSTMSPLGSYSVSDVIIPFAFDWNINYFKHIKYSNINPDLCYMKMTVTLKDTKGATLDLQSQFDSLFSPVIPSDILNRLETRTWSSYEPIGKMRCDDVRDLNDNLLPIWVTPNANLKLGVYAFDLDGTRKMIKEIPIPVSQIKKTTLNGVSPEHEEVLFTFGSQSFDLINNALSKNLNSYSSKVEYVLTGDLTMEIPYLSQKTNSKHEFKHTINSDRVRTTHQITVLKLTADGSDGGGDTITITELSPTVLDNGLSSARQIKVVAKLDDWTNTEGLPFMQVYKKSTGLAVTSKIQMEFERSDGVYSFFKGFYRAPVGLAEGVYDIKVTSNIGGLFNQPLRPNVAVSTFQVIDSTPPDSDGDGIPDSVDKCPTVAGVSSNGGCPAENKCTSSNVSDCPMLPEGDDDGDGIKNNVDKCPTVAGVSSNGGCPAEDSDGDGIIDSEDACPTVAGTKEFNGCPNDSTEPKPRVTTCEDSTSLICWFLNGLIKAGNTGGAIDFAGVLNIVMLFVIFIVVVIGIVYGISKIVNKRPPVPYYGG